MIEKLSFVPKGFCIVCGHWDELPFRDTTLGPYGVCGSCALLLRNAEEALAREHLTQPPVSLILSSLHRLA